MLSQEQELILIEYNGLYPMCTFESCIAKGFKDI